MRWILACAVIFALSADEKPPLKEKVKEKTPPPFDADLFRRNEQVTSAHAEVLYWTVNEGALDYALKMRHSAWGPTASYAQGTMKSGTFDWDPGFRITLSYFRAPRFWEVRGSYTRLTCSGDDHTNKPKTDTKFITGTWPQILTAPLASATSHLHMNYNVFDLNINRFYNPNPHLRIRLLAGFITSWIDQYWKVRYTDSSLNNSIIRNRWKFVGAGLKGGLMFDWYWGNNVYMTGTGSVGSLVGRYTNSSEQTTTVQPDPTDNTSVPIRDMHLTNTRPAFTAQMSFGPSWQKNFEHQRVEVFLGYELNVWANLNEIYHSTSGAPTQTKETWINSSWTGLQGATFRITADF